MAPIQGKRRVRLGTIDSTNWSGYAAFNDTFKDVKGTWVQPSADCSGVKGRQETVAAFWSGLDGLNSGTVEQTGTEADCIGTTPLYLAWVEFYPARTVVYSDTVKPGDSLTAEVSQNGATVTATLHDSTEGWTESRSIPADKLAFSSAEWIAEAPTNLMTDFGAVGFSSASATDTNNHTGAINDTAWSNDQIILVSHNGRITRAKPGDLNRRGTAFTDTWMHF